MAARLPLALYRMHKLGICSSVLDYGTGKGFLVERLRAELPESIEVFGYDPAVDKWSCKPNFVPDILTCFDVLEHIELDSIDSIIDDIYSMNRNFCYVVIDLQPAVKKLADGRNAHVLLAPPDWWLSRFSRLFSCLTSFVLPHENGHIQKMVIVASKSTEMLPNVYSFLNKVNVYGKCFKGGVSV